MNLRISAVLASVLALVLCACPPAKPVTDGGEDPKLDGGNPNLEDKCSGGCSANQRCDTAKRICVDACAPEGQTVGGCDAGVCIKDPITMAFSCVNVVTTCVGNACEAGQIACIAGQCACLSTNKAAADSCAPNSKWCVDGNCVPPKRFQQCKPGGTPCPTGHLCSPVFSRKTPGTCEAGETPCICTKECASPNDCDRGEGCSTDGCLPASLFRDQECGQQVMQPDGGLTKLTVPVGNKCLIKDGMGQPTEAVPTGNCSYAFLGFYDDPHYSVANCRPPGPATLGQACKQDFSLGAIATTCSTGLECALTRGGDQGVCVKACNAAPTYPGFSPQPACGSDEACANLYRLEDSNAVLGGCMKKCNVFDPTKNVCANVGASVASCVPTTADGKFVVSVDGSGVCIPQRVPIVAEGMPCVEQDSFKGATCGSSQVCASLSVSAVPTCYATCDTSCNDAVPPARCATEPNARCQGGKKCNQVTSTTGAILGFCK